MKFISLAFVIFFSQPILRLNNHQSGRALTRLMTAPST